TLLDLRRGRIELGSAQIFGHLRYRDSYHSLEQANPALTFDNSVVSTTFAVIPYVGYAAPIGGRVAWGIAAYAQVGGGVDINGITSLLPLEAEEPVPLIMTRTLRDQFQGAVFFKVTPGAAVAVGRLRLGVGLDVVYGQLENKITFYDEERTDLLLRYNYQGDPQVEVGGKVGATYTLGLVTVGYAYMLKNTFDFDGTFTETDTDGKRTRARVQNRFVLPDRHSLGAAVTYGPWTAAYDANFVRYGAYFRHRRLVLSEPLFPGNAVVSDDLVNYKDQWHMNVGLEYRLGPWAWRTGWNHGRSPIRNYTVSPEDNLIAQDHGQVGIEYRTRGGVTLDLAVERAFENREAGDYNTAWGKQRFFSRADTYSVALRQTLVYFAIGCDM
ncbi:MAG: hypothetical protein AB1505_20815, partial [Candidatus Latescibacterota bacterium]